MSKTEKKSQEKHHKKTQSEHLSALLHREKRKKKEEAPSLPRPAFAKEKKLFKRRSFCRQYAIFRKGGLGILDSFFNALYIELTEKSVEKEERRCRELGESVSPDRHLELHTPLLKLLSFFPNRAGRLLAGMSAFWKKREGGTHHGKILFLKRYGIQVSLLILLAFVAVFVAIQLSRPVVLRAEIDGKVIAVVDNKYLVDSTVNELEDEVEFILGESFHFPYEIKYQFARQWGTRLTEKNVLYERLYQYVLDSVCTAAGLYVDDVLVAVCEDEDAIYQGLADFINSCSKGEDCGILNEILVLTQAYPTESLLNSKEFRQLLNEMSTPLEERTKKPVPGDSILQETMAQVVSQKEDTEQAVPTMALVADNRYIPTEKKTSKSNFPQSIDGLKLDVYVAEILNYEAEIPFETVYGESERHFTTMADIIVRGVNGRAQVQAKVFYLDGKEVKREILSQKTIQMPRNQVISIGTRILPENLGISLGEQRFILPRLDTVTSPYGEREEGMHHGMDIDGDEGDNLYAAASGTVVVAIGQDGYFSNRPNNLYTGYGFCVVIEHDGGYSTMYAHCSSICVTLGQKVKQGDKIAEVGNTGWSDGDHVHFELIRNGIRLNPTQYLYQGTKTIYD